MTQTPEQTEKEIAQEMVAPYIQQINSTPALLSLLYDADLLPEQIISRRGAVSLAAVVVAYSLGAGQSEADGGAA